MSFVEVSSQSAIEHLLTHKPKRLKRVCFHIAPQKMGQRLLSLQGLAKEKGILVDYQEWDKKDKRVPEPVTAYVLPFEYQELKPFLAKLKERKHALVLALDHIQDPQNLGALARTAEALGISGILLPKDCAAAVGPGVYNASVGAIETIDVVSVNNLNEALRRLKDEGFWIVGAALDEKSTPPSKVPDFEKAVIVLGAELEGLSSSTLQNCDWLVEIPLKGRVQSLNVSVAGAILMYDLAQKSGGAL